MKKSGRSWLVAFTMSLLPLIYVSAKDLQLPVLWDDLYGYFALGAGLLSTIPIWTTAISKGQVGIARQMQMTLLAILLSYAYAFISGNVLYYWQPTALTSLALLTGWLVKAQLETNLARVPNLAALVPDKATVIDGRDLEHVEQSSLEIGQVVLVRPGNVIPADGFVIQGQSSVSEVSITGDDSAILKQPGDWVLAGSENLPGRSSEHAPLTIRVSAIGDDLVVHELARSIDTENRQPAKYSKFATISASILTFFSISAALILAGLELVFEFGLEAAFSVAIGVLLATQVAVARTSVEVASAASSIKAACLGVILRSRATFEALAKINHVVLNKTGVITKGHTAVGKIHLARNTSIGSEGELLALAASVEMGTSHELGHLLIQEAAKRGLELPKVTDFAPIPGLGVSARFDGSLVQVGNAGMVNVSGVNMNPYDLFQVSSALSAGSSVVFVGIDELLVGYIEFPDEVRANSQAAIVKLSGKQAITVLSGDSHQLVEKITQGLGLSEFAAEVLSTRKADWVKEKRANGSKLLLVADGHYDAAALIEADVALAFGTGPNVHLGSANLIQISQDPLTIPHLLKLSKATQSKSFWNITFALMVSLGLMAASVLGVSPPLIALAGSAFTWLAIARVVRLSK
jgi:Cu2+-exporting ATPase